MSELSRRAFLAALAASGAAGLLGPRARGGHRHEDQGQHVAFHNQSIPSGARLPRAHDSITMVAFTRPHSSGE